ARRPRSGRPPARRTAPVAGVGGRGHAHGALGRGGPAAADAAAGAPRQRGRHPLPARADRGRQPRRARPRPVPRHRPAAGHAAHPGCWVRLVAMAAEGIDAAHRAGLVHGRLTSDSFVLTATGVLKVTGFGEPAWLPAGSTDGSEPAPAADLRALGQVAFGWS